MTARSLGQVRELTLPRVPRALMSATSRAYWEAAEWPLPACIEAFAWECRLARGGGPVDLQCQVSRSAASSSPSAEEASDPWLFVRSFVQDWAGGGRSAVSALFIEMDEAGAPMLFCRIAALDPALWLLSAGSLLHRLSRGGAPGDVHQALIQAVLALPAGGTPLYVGWMGARGLPVARFIASVPCAGLADYLRKTGWPGDCDALASEVRSLNPWSSHVPVGFDVGRCASPVVGVELHWSGEPRRGDRTHIALDRLADWPELDPVRVRAAEQWLDAEASEIAPRLQLKLGFSPEGRTAKAYLGAWTEAFDQGVLPVSAPTSL